MSKNPGDVKQPFLDRSVWAEPLFKFAQVSRLVVSLYDRHGKRWCGPCFNQGFAARLARAGVWDDAGWARADEQKLVQRCVLQKKPVYESIFGLFGQLAVPCQYNGEVVLVFVLGWVPEYGPDATTLKSLAEQLNIPLEEIHPLIRMMPPISEDRLRTHGHMLEVFSSSLLQQLALHDQTQREGKGWRILSDTAFALAGVTTEREICQIAHRALRTLLPDAYALIQLVPREGESEPQGLLDREDRVVLSMMPHVTSVRRHHSVPIRGQADQIFGQIEITLEYGKAFEDHLETLHILAEQIGVALQKSRFLSRLERERSTLRPVLKKKDEFLAAVSQKLKVPLHAMMGWAQVLDQKEQDPDHHRDALQMIERHVQHQAHLIKDLLDLSRSISAADDKPQVRAGQPGV